MDPSRDVFSFVLSSFIDAGSLLYVFMFIHIITEKMLTGVTTFGCYPDFYA